MQVYENVKAICKDKKISIRQAEIMAGIGNGVIRGWRYKSPTIDTLTKVAKILGVSVNDLYKGELSKK